MSLSANDLGNAIQTVRGACPHDCPDTCAWQVVVENGRAVRLVGDSEHPFTRGGLCAKVNHFLDRVYSPDRVLHPLRRVGPKGRAEFERVSWDEALDDITARLKAIIAEPGPTAILPYSFAGSQGIAQMLGLNRRFFARLGASRLVRNICGAVAAAGVSATIGTGLGIRPESLAHSRFIVLWSTNTIVTNLHLWPIIRQAKEQGATIVVVDPLKTRTAEAADWHVRPLPGTDAALALGLMHVIVREGLHDRDYVERYTLGFDALAARLAEFPPGRVAQLTGLEADEIVRLARAYATTRPAVIRLLIGMEHHANGAMAYRTIAGLPALIGAWRERGGGLFYVTSSLFTRALDFRGVMMPALEDRSIRAINMVQLGRALTDPSLSPPIKALFVYNSNPATIAPNQNLVREGLAREDLFTVVHEQLLTDTAAYADYVLPATTQVEQLDLMNAWGHTYLELNQPAIAPRGESVSNNELFRRLAARLGLDEPYLYESDEEIIRTALSSGSPSLNGITYERLAVEGWAPLDLPTDDRPYAEGHFPTRSGRCEFFSESLAARGHDPLPTYAPPAESPAGDPALAARYPLQLIATKSGLHFLNSSYAGLERHRRAEGEPWLDLHPADAMARGIEDAARVRVFNDRGEVVVRARVGDRVRPGVVALPHGWWASLSPGGSSANALTSDDLTDWGEGGAFHDTLVQVSKARTS